MERFLLFQFFQDGISDGVFLCLANPFDEELSLWQIGGSPS